MYVRGCKVDSSIDMILIAWLWLQSVKSYIMKSYSWLTLEAAKQDLNDLNLQPVDMKDGRIPTHSSKLLRLRLFSHYL
jgi:hypothetical protein